MAWFQNIKFWKPLKSSIHCIIEFVENLEPLIWMWSHRYKSSPDELILFLRNGLYCLVMLTNPLVCHPTQEQVPVDFHYDCPLDVLIMVLSRENHQGRLVKTHFVFKCVRRMLIACVSAKASVASWQTFYFLQPEAVK